MWVTATLPHTQGDAAAANSTVLSRLGGSTFADLADDAGDHTIGSPGGSVAGSRLVDFLPAEKVATERQGQADASGGGRGAGGGGDGGHDRGGDSNTDAVAADDGDDFGIELMDEDEGGGDDAATAKDGAATTTSIDDDDFGIEAVVGGGDGEDDGADDEDEDEDGGEGDDVDTDGAAQQEKSNREGDAAAARESKVPSVDHPSAADTARRRHGQQHDARQPRETDACSSTAGAQNEATVRTQINTSAGPPSQVSWLLTCPLPLRIRFFFNRPSDPSVPPSNPSACLSRSRLHARGCSRQPCQRGGLGLDLGLGRRCRLLTHALCTCWAFVERQLVARAECYAHA